MAIEGYTVVERLPDGRAVLRFEPSGETSIVERVPTVEEVAWRARGRPPGTSFRALVEELGNPSRRRRT